MKNLIAIAISLIISITVFGQATAEWKGGTPGNKNCWHEAKNWSTNKVPDEFTFVIIKAQNNGHFAQPVISENIEIGGIEIHKRTSLSIKPNTEIFIDGAYSYDSRFVNYGGTVINKGIIILDNIEEFSEDNFEHLANTSGQIFLNGVLINFTCTEGDYVGSE